MSEKEKTEYILKHFSKECRIILQDFRKSDNTQPSIKRKKDSFNESKSSAATPFSQYGNEFAKFVEGRKKNEDMERAQWTKFGKCPKKIPARQELETHMSNQKIKSSKRIQAKQREEQKMLKQEQPKSAKINENKTNHKSKKSKKLQTRRNKEQVCKEGLPKSAKINEKKTEVIPTDSVQNEECNPSSNKTCPALTDEDSCSSHNSIKTSRYLCTTCTIYFSDIQEIKSHSHKNYVCKYHCKKCNRLFSTRSGFIVHVLYHDMENKKDQMPVLVTQINENHLTFDNVSSLAPQSFGSSSVESADEMPYLKREVLTDYVCDDCYDAFMTLDELCKHQEIHRKIKTEDAPSTHIESNNSGELADIVVNRIDVKTVENGKTITLKDGDISESSAALHATNEILTMNEYVSDEDNVGSEQIDTDDIFEEGKVSSNNETNQHIYIEKALVEKEEKPANTENKHLLTKRNLNFNDQNNQKPCDPQQEYEQIMKEERSDQADTTTNSQLEKSKLTTRDISEANYSPEEEIPIISIPESAYNVFSEMYTLDHVSYMVDNTFEDPTMMSASEQHQILGNSDITAKESCSVSAKDKEQTTLSVRRDIFAGESPPKGIENLQLVLEDNIKHNKTIHKKLENTASLNLTQGDMTNILCLTEDGSLKKFKVNDINDSQKSGMKTNSSIFNSLAPLNRLLLRSNACLPKLRFFAGSNISNNLITQNSGPSQGLKAVNLSDLGLGAQIIKLPHQDKIQTVVDDSTENAKQLKLSATSDEKTPDLLTSNLKKNCRNKSVLVNLKNGKIEKVLDDHGDPESADTTSGTSGSTVCSDETLPLITGVYSVAETLENVHETKPSTAIPSSQYGNEFAKFVEDQKNNEEVVLSKKRPGWMKFAE